MTSAGQNRQLPQRRRRHGRGQGANLQLRTIPAAGAKTRCQAEGNRHRGWTAGHTRQVSQRRAPVPQRDIAEEFVVSTTTVRPPCRVA